VQFKIFFAQYSEEKCRGEAAHQNAGQSLDRPEQSPLKRIKLARSPRTALSPKTREKAVADQDDIGWPFGMLREQSFLGLNAVNQRRPTNQHEEERDGIPFL
jgi:hypothetical protein